MSDDSRVAELERRVDVAHEEGMRIVRRLSGQDKHDPTSVWRLITGLSRDYHQILDLAISLARTAEQPTPQSARWRALRGRE